MSSSVIPGIGQGRWPRRRDAAAAGEEQLGRCTAEQSKYYRLYLYRGKLTLAAIYLRRVRVADLIFAATLTHFFKVVEINIVAAFVVNSEPHNGARALVRVCARVWG
jgi:hypothetical protein